MTFTSFEFVAFFLFVAVGLGVLRSLSAEKWFLLSASLFFCLISSVSCVILILFITIVDFSIARKLGSEADPIRRKRLLALSLGSSLGLLGFFKYTDFVLANLRLSLNSLGLQFPQVQLNIAAPPGISFFVFASVSYVVDVYYKRLKACESPQDYGLFLTFFPKLLSGPIVRAGQFLPQLKARMRPAAGDLEIGIAYVLIGAVKKLVIADQIVGHINLIFAAPAQFDGFTLLQGMVGYAVQIYCDFSGYSDMAVGVARLLGFKLPENFQMPFAAVTITEYWRRWHITMSTWFRDYLFFPTEMAGRKAPYPTLRTATNLIATFLVCGLWHGAGWTFVIWGGIHGVAMAVHVVWRKWNPFVSLNDSRGFQATWSCVSRALTLAVVLISGVYFRAQSVGDANIFLSRVASWSPDGTRMVSPFILPAVLVVFLVHLFQNKDCIWPQEISMRSTWMRTMAYTSLLLILVMLGATSTTPFVYFQF